ncbi:hypothetical protein CesoFtcFv8_005762 [Champsocephalus esox]|uniref:Uncharacterized protein n=1 Tax=Champsocephalus esox TaxID=159716 RepID=A0AAN8CIF4_9TELE|nr:hypothetical protein CesoFtcFv8_005762 [Champsocephalus esox]
MSCPVGDPVNTCYAKGPAVTSPCFCNTGDYPADTCSAGGPVNSESCPVGGPADTVSCSVEGPTDNKRPPELSRLRPAGPPELSRRCHLLARLCVRPPEFPLPFAFVAFALEPGPLTFPTTAFALVPSPLSSPAAILL